jgi:hypothetical protein
MTQIPDHKRCVGPGWHPILDQLHTDIVALDPEYSVAQVKEKFGGLRAYLVYRNPEITALVTAAETLSAVTCENCGIPGRIRNRKDSRWLQCLCDLCVLPEPDRQTTTEPDAVLDSLPEVAS